LHRIYRRHFSDPDEIIPAGKAARRVVIAGKTGTGISVGKKVCFFAFFFLLSASFLRFSENVRLFFYETDLNSFT
jgi:hypothetical protein